MNDQSPGDDSVASSPSVRCVCIKVTDLERHCRDAMYELFSRHYDRTERDRFEQDLARKDWVLQLFDPKSGRLCGFSTQVLLRFALQGQNLRVLFSGDTIVDPRYWGETALIREWGRLVAKILNGSSNDPLYWYLISKGYKTYRFLPVFFREFYPRFDDESSSGAREIVDALGERLFAGDYDAERGLVIASPDKDRLRPELAHVSPSRLSDPHIRFFLERNPGYVRGDELCCLAPLGFENFKPAGIRLLDPENRPSLSRVRCE